ncbi:MAG: hypothetical protein V4671_16440 [Armatimonadota bacterium]
MQQKQWKTLAGITAAAGIAFFAGTAYTRPVPAPQEATILDPSMYIPNYAYDGLLLASAPMSSSEESGILRGLMGVQIFKFAVKKTKPISRVTYILELREKGKPTKVLSEHTKGPVRTDGVAQSNIALPTLSNLYVAFLPLNKDLSEAEKIKYTIFGEGLSCTSVIDNPFKGATVSGSPDTIDNEKDIPLFSGSRTFVNPGSYTYPDRTLYLRLKTVSAQ